MADKIEFEVNEEFFHDTVEVLSERTEYEPEEVRRGLLYMIGRRSALLFQTLTEEDPDELMKELEIAILHSSQEK